MLIRGKAFEAIPTFWRLFEVRHYKRNDGVISLLKYINFFIVSFKVLSVSGNINEIIRSVLNFLFFLT